MGAGARVGGDFALGGLGEAGAQRGVGDPIAERRGGGSRRAGLRLTFPVASRRCAETGQDNEGLPGGRERLRVPGVEGWLEGLLGGVGSALGRETTGGGDAQGIAYKARSGPWAASSAPVTRRSPRCGWPAAVSTSAAEARAGAT